MTPPVIPDLAGPGKLLAAKQRLGRDIRVYETAHASTKPGVADVIDEPKDYSRFHAIKQDKRLKTLKLRKAEEAARRAKYTKSTIKVQFPDNCTLEVTFHPSDTIQSLIDLLKQVLSEPERPFYIYTTPPKEQLKDMSQDFFSAGFIPGAIVYFAYDVPKGEDSSSITIPFLEEAILSLKGLLLTSGEVTAVASKEQPSPATSSPRVPHLRVKAIGKKLFKPKWFKRCVSKH